MSEEVKNFVDALANANADQAGEAFKDALRAKVGDALDNQRKELAGNLFNGQQEVPTEAQPYSDPKPEVADVGTFNKDGTVNTLKNDGEAELDLTQDNENQ
jgi:hypothetical protein